MDGGMLSEIRIFGGNFSPRGWASCSGQQLSINDYPGLYSILGFTYGGNERTTFALPNMENRVVIGVSTGKYFKKRPLGGLYSVYLTEGRMPAHTHRTKFPAHPKVTAKVRAYSGKGKLTNNPVGNYPAQTPDGTNIYSTTYNSTMQSSTFQFNVLPETSTVGNGSMFNIVQPSLGTNYIICISGIYPSRN